MREHASAMPAQWLRRLRSIPAPLAWLSVIVLLIPLEWSKTLFPISQIELSRLAILGAIAWEARRLLIGARPVPRALGLALTMVAAVLLGSEALTRWSDGLLIVAALVVYLAFFTFTADAITNQRALAVVGASLVFSAAAVSLVAIAEKVGGFYIWHEGLLNVLGRTNATFADPNILARFLDLSLAVAIGFAFLRPWQDRRVGSALLVCIALIGAGLVETQSRTGWALAVLVLAAWSVVSLRRRWALGAVATFVIAFAAAMAVNSIAFDRLGGVVTTPDDPYYAPPRIVIGHQLIRALPLDSIRVYLLEAGIAMWEDHPLVGVGTGGFEHELLGDYRGFIPPDRQPPPATLPHTSLAQTAAENGAVGLLSLLVLAAVVVALVTRGLRAADPGIRAAAFAIGLAAAVIFLSSQMEGRLLDEPYLWLTLGGLAALERLRRARGDGARPGGDLGRRGVLRGRLPARA